MVTVKSDTRVRSIEPPNVSSPRGASSPNADTMLDNLLEETGLKRSEGGTA